MTSSLSRGDTIRKRCGLSKGIGMNLANFVRQFNITDEVVKMMYNTVIFPTMVFGLRGVALTKSNRSKLRRYERDIIVAMRRNSRKTQSDKTVQEFLAGKTVNRRIRVLRSSYYGHVQRRPRNHLLQHAFRYQPGIRKVGRPCITWLDSLRQDRNKYPYDYSEWLAAAEDKAEIKGMAETIYGVCENDSSEDDYFLSEDEPY